jgi:hypothetical protein
MQSLARSAVAPAMRQSFRRSFVSSAARAQAVPTEKPVLMKEFKIYRWVRIPFRATRSRRGRNVLVCALVLSR